MIINEVVDGRLSNAGDFLRPGTILAFAGKGAVSKLIQARTFSRISHIGVMYDYETIVESTQLRGFTGVVKHKVTDLKDYKGRVYACNIDQEVAKIFGRDRHLKDFLDRQVGKKYDVKQAAQSGMDLLDWIPFIGKATKSKQNQDKWFCSEIGYAALEVWAPAIFGDLNESEITPSDIWTLPVFTSRTRII